MDIPDIQNSVTFLRIRTFFSLSDELHREKGSDGPESVESVENRPGRVGSACCQA